jgi:hypothetical protein
MDEQKYKIVFKGETVPGSDPDTVKRSLAKFYKVDIQKAGALFSGKAFILKEGVDLDSAQKYMLQFEQMGAICIVEKLMIEEKKSAPPPPAEPPEEIDIKPEPPKPEAPRLKPTPGSHPSAYSFKKPAKKSNLSIFLILFVIIVVAVVIFKVIQKNEPISATPSTTEETRATQTQTTSSPSEIITQKIPGPEISTDKTELYTDPNERFTVILPSGFAQMETKMGVRSRVTFTYGSKAAITITVGPLDRKWDPQMEMAAKMNGVSSGALGPEFSQFSVDKYGTLNLSGMDGYEILLVKDNNRFARHYAFVNSKEIAFNIVIITMGPDAQNNISTLENTIRTAFRAD